MPRTIVDLPSSQIRDLDSRCRAEGISRAEAVRRAIHAYLREPQGDSEQGFGLWKEGAGRSQRTKAEDK
jgi:metal-responsive CopG/Arc/MetJ family transcriptional regulator